MANPAGPGAGSRNAPGTASAPQIPLPAASVTLSSDHHLRRPYRSRCAGPRETPYPWEKWSADIQRQRSTSAAYHEAVEYWHQDLSKTFEECFKVCLDSRGLGCGWVEEGNCAKGAKSLDQRPGTASREEHKSAHMLPSPPQMPPPIELRIEKVLRQHTSRARSACPRQSSAIGQAPSLDGPDEPGIASSWKHNSKPEVGVWHADEGQEERQREQKRNRHLQTDGQVAEGWRWSSAWTGAWASSPNDLPGSASSWDRDWKSGVCAWHTHEGREGRQREPEDNHHGWRWQTDGQVAEGGRWSRASTSDWASDPFDGPGSASSGGHDCESKVCFDRSDDRKASLQDAMRKWAEQASMREDKAVDIARKSKAKRQRESGDAHRAWLDRKYLKRALKRLRQPSSSTALAPGTASARAKAKKATS